MATDTSTWPNWIWRAGFKAGWDIERGAAATPSFWQGALASAQAVKATHIGMTIPYTPYSYAYYAGKQNQLTQPFSDATINAYLDCVAAHINAGIKVRLNCGDVTQYVDVMSYGSYINTHLSNCARLITARKFPKNMLAVGCFAEMANNNNAFWMPQLAQYYSYLLGMLPAGSALSSTRSSLHLQASSSRHRSSKRWSSRRITMTHNTRNPIGTASRRTWIRSRVKLDVPLSSGRSAFITSTPTVLTVPLPIIRQILRTE